MAIRRMLSQKIINTDAFLDMPLSAQALYMHLNGRADDDGFVGNPKTIMRLINCGEDNLNILLAKNFVLSFENGVVVIKHWLIHNTIRKDRYSPTTYLDEKEMLDIKPNKSYTFNKVSKGLGKPHGNQVETQVSVVKSSVVESSEIIPFPVVAEKEKGPIPFKEIIEYLNLRAGSKFKHTTKKTRALITTRWNEGFNLEDFHIVIDNARAFWLNKGSDLTYLRPETVFNGSFESRLHGSSYAHQNKGIDEDAKLSEAKKRYQEEE